MPESYNKILRFAQYIFYKIRFYNFYFISTLAYFLYLLTLPNLVALAVPCLRFAPLQAFSYTDCNINLVLKNFLIFSFAGFSLVLLLLLIFRPRRELKPLLITATILAVATVGVFYVDLLPLIRQTDRAQLYVDTIPR